MAGYDDNGTGTPNRKTPYKNVIQEHNRAVEQRVSEVMASSTTPDRTQRVHPNPEVRVQPSQPSSYAPRDGNKRKAYGKPFGEQEVNK